MPVGSLMQQRPCHPRQVETPVLERSAGGAEARPFLTFHNALGRSFALRIATGGTGKWTRSARCSRQVAWKAGQAMMDTGGQMLAEARFGQGRLFAHHHGQIRFLSPCEPNL